MRTKYLFPLIALSMATSMAGERECFDFDWKFKYFGGYDPALAGSAASANTHHQGGHAASNAVDGNLDTRWCAPNPKAGHKLMVRPGFDDPVQLFSIYWEKVCHFDVTITVKCKNGKTITEKFNAGGQAATFVTMKDAPQPIDYVIISIDGGTSRSQWASIKEVIFTGVDNKPIPVKQGETAYVHALPTASEEGYKPVQLPHDWAIESPFLADEPNETGKLPWNGWGWYRKHFDVPADFDPAKDRYFLDFDGVMANPKVYVNGVLAGEWAYGYNSFRVDLTPHLKAGQKNLIAVMASNLSLSSRWYPGAGIYRHVWLEKTGPVHLAQWPTYITTPQISADNATVKIQTGIINSGTESVEVEVQQQVAGMKAQPSTITIPPGTESIVEQEIHIPNPKIWSCEEPNLYTAETTILINGKAVDTKQSRFGIRSVEWRKDGFYLNGKRVPLKGVCEHHDLGALGGAFHKRGYERKIEKLKAMGCNSIRMTHNPPAPEVLDLCDEHGILVIDELFDIWKRQKYEKVNGYHIYWDKWWKKDVRNFMLRDRNHPSIIAWSGGNEVPEQSAPKNPKRHQENLAIAHGLRDEIRKYDTTRPYTVGCNDQNAFRNGFVDTMDVYGFNYKPHLYPLFRQMHPDKPYYGSETCSCVGTRDTYAFPLRWHVQGGYEKVNIAPFQVSAYGVASTHWGYCPDIEFHAHTKAPDVAGEYVWTGFDYLGEPTPFNQDATIEGNIKHLPEAERKAIMAQYEAMGNKAPSRSSYFGIIDLAGFPKDIYYLYQSRWNPELPQAHILPHWNWKGREGETTPVMVFTSGDEAELFVNGKSQGVRKRGDGDTFRQKGRDSKNNNVPYLDVSKNQYRFTWEDVVYEPGTVEVVVKKDGKPWATAKRVTTGDSVSVHPVVDRPSIINDGHDLAHLELALTDKDGNVVPTDCRKVEFSIDGPAVLAGFCNGNPVDQTCLQNPQQCFFNGRILAVVRSKRGESGTATVTIRAEGLPEIKVPVKVAPAQ